MGIARQGACSAQLPDGTVLITGGADSSGALSSVELFDGIDFTAATPMGTARSGHMCAMLADGSVLVAGGTASDSSTLDSAEIFNPATGRWTSAGRMNAPHGCDCVAPARRQRPGCWWTIVRSAHVEP